MKNEISNVDLKDNVLFKETIENDHSKSLFMNSSISAIYQQGVLCPLEPLALPESANVQIQVISPEYFIISRPRYSNAFQRRLVIIHELLAEIEENWENESDQEIFPQILQIDLKLLWHLCQTSHREFCAMLELSAMHLEPNELTLEQVAAFRLGLGIIEQEVIAQKDMDHIHDLLIDAGLPPSFSFDHATVQSYLDEF